MDCRVLQVHMGRKDTQDLEVKMESQVIRGVVAREVSFRQKSTI